jgi:small glutamine-rich tetratricopeptide repeat-containing protein alpha
MPITDEDRAIVATCLKFLEDQIKTAELPDEAVESLAVAMDCVNNVYHVTGAERTVDIREAYRTAIKAVPAPKEATEEEKKKAEELKNEGNNLLKDGKHQEAIDAYSKAIDLDPSNAVYFSNRAAVHLKLGDNDAALADCDKALKLDPGYSKAYCRKGVAHMNKEENERARDCFQRAADIEPANDTYKSNLKVAEEKIETARREAAQNLFAGGAGGFPDLGGMAGGFPGGFPGMMDPSAILGNPTFMQMASRVMQDPAMQQIMGNVVRSLVGDQPGEEGEGAPPEGGGPPDLSSILRVGQQLAQQMASANPDLIDELRRQGAGADSEDKKEGEEKKPE